MGFDQSGKWFFLEKLYNLFVTLPLLEPSKNMLISGSMGCGDVLGEKNRIFELVHYNIISFASILDEDFYPFPFQWICFDKAKFWMLV
jgi:hypothetical protein